MSVRDTLFLYVPHHLRGVAWRPQSFQRSCFGAHVGIDIDVCIVVRFSYNETSPLTTRTINWAEMRIYCHTSNLIVPPPLRRIHQTEPNGLLVLHQSLNTTSDYIHHLNARIIRRSNCAICIIGDNGGFMYQKSWEGVRP